MVADGKVVSMNYTLRDDSGEVIDESHGEPLEFLAGHQNIIPGLERELVGLKIGDKKQVKVQPEDGYGVRDESMFLTIPREQFGAEAPAPNMMVQLQSREGHHLQARIVEVDDKSVRLDANHPLAGKILHFEIEIAGVRDATKEEIQHGHPHGPHGHHH